MRVSGVYAQEVECLVCHNVTSREDPFYDLQLDVAGYESLIQSLDHFVAKEELKGPNQYNCAQCKKKVKDSLFIVSRSVKSNAGSRNGDWSARSFVVW